MNPNIYKLLRNLSKILLIVIGVGLVGYLGYLTYGSLTAVPRKVRITNLTESSATVSWITDSPTKGVVYYKEADSFLPGPLAPFQSKKAYDDRDYYGAQLDNINSVNEKNLGNKEADEVIDTDKIEYEDFEITKLGNYYTHHVTIRGLEPEKKYYFAVSDNWFSWNVEGVNQERNLTEIPTVVEFGFSTLSRLNTVPAPDPAYGKVLGVYRDEDGLVYDNLNQDSIVFSMLSTEDMEEQTSLYSSITNSEGGWVIDKSTMRSKEGLLPYNFKDGEDLIILYPQYINLEESQSLSFLLGEEDSPCEDLIGGQELEDIGSGEEGLLNNLLHIFSYKSFAREIVDDTGGVLLVVSGSSSTLSKGKGAVSVVGGGAVAKSMKAAISTAKSQPGSSTNSLLLVAGKAAEAKRKDKAYTEEEIKKDAKTIFPVVDAPSGEGAGSGDSAADEAIKQAIEDIRNTPKLCSEIKTNDGSGRAVRSSEYWAYNCVDAEKITKDNNLKICSGGAEAAGCGTNSACYQGGRGYANKCTGCARPANCANVMARETDVVVNGNLYTKTDLFNAVLVEFFGGESTNEAVKSLLSGGSLGSVVLCFSQDKDRIVKVVDSASKCPTYSYPDSGLSNLSNLKTEKDIENCKKIITRVGGEGNANSYCKSGGEGGGAGGEGDIPSVVTPIGCPTGSKDCKKDDIFNCQSLKCDGEYITRKITRDGEGCFCYKTTSIPFPSTVDAITEKTLYEIPFLDKNAFLTKDWSIIRDYLLTINGEIVPGVETVMLPGGLAIDGTVRKVKVYLSKEDKTKLDECLTLKLGCDIYKHVYPEYIKEMPDKKYYDESSNSFNQIGDILYDDDEVSNYAKNLGVSKSEILSNVIKYEKAGFLELSPACMEKEGVCLRSIKLNSDAMESFKKSTRSMPVSTSISNGGFANYTEIIPSKEGTYNLKAYTVCPTVANDRFHCSYFLANNSEDIVKTFGLEKNKFDIKENNQIERDVVSCPKDGNCIATYKVTYETASTGKVSETLVLPYDGGNDVRVLNIGGQNYTLKVDSETIKTNELDYKFDEDSGIEKTGFKDLGNEVEESLSSFLYKILGVFAPSKVQAQQSDPYASSEQGLYEIITASGKTVHYVDTTNQQYIIFYEEGNNEPGFQEPLDINNPQTGEDVLVFVNKDSIKKISQAYDYWIEEGINMMSFPFIPVNQDKRAMMASELMIANNGVATKISQITYFENGKWNGGIKASGDNQYVGFDFPIVPGRGYLIVGEYGTSISIPGFALDKPFPVELSAGWNFVGVHGYNDIYTAEKLIDSMDQLEGVDVDNVTWWPRNLGRYESLQKSEDTLYGFDYPLSDRLGYFVRVASYSNKCPRSVLWNPGGETDGICGSN